MQRRLYIDEAHTALDIFRFAVFLNNNSKKKFREEVSTHHIIDIQPSKYQDSSIHLRWYIHLDVPVYLFTKKNLYLNNCWRDDYVHHLVEMQDTFPSCVTMIITISWVCFVYSDIVIPPTQPQLNSKVGFDMKMTLDHHHHHCTATAVLCCC